MIQFFDRRTQKIQTEKVYGDRYLKLAYQHPVGLALTDYFFSKRWLSLLMGKYENSSFSAKKIKNFIQQYEINMNEFENIAYANFNEFFIRRFKPGLRSFNPDPKVFCAGAEARYFAFENIGSDTRLPVKGIHIHLQELLRHETLAKSFEGGTILIARLCPVDYHRYHFPVSGSVTQAYSIHGTLHSVNPVALLAKPDVFLINERQVALLEGAPYGQMAMIEVGALGVGRMVQSAYSEKGPFPVKFDKGQEKGYFLFGGSTVIWILPKGKLSLSQDLKENSLNGIETWVPLGDSLGEFR